MPHATRRALASVLPSLVAIALAAAVPTTGAAGESTRTPGDPAASDGASPRAPGSAATGSPAAGTPASGASPAWDGSDGASPSGG